MFGSTMFGSCSQEQVSQSNAKSASGAHLECGANHTKRSSPLLLEYFTGLSEFSLQVMLHARQLISSSVKGTGQDN